MNYLKFSIPLFVCYILSGCSDMPEIAYSKTERPHTITESEALSIAQKVLSHAPKSRVSDLMPQCEYILSTEASASRSSANNDTLAYVFNYPDNNGFVMVSRDNRVYPVLAFSNTGNFSFDNEIVAQNFTSKLSEYIGNTTSNNAYNVSEQHFESCYVINPSIKTSLDQGSPWDKYVIQEHPGCPVGCVAVASALAMIHTEKQLVYHDETYKMDCIINAIYSEQNKFTDISKRYIGSVQEGCSYEVAVDKIAKLLYWIGKDINMRYTVGASYASSDNAYKLMESLGYQIPSGHVKYDISAITEYLKSDHIIYITGYSSTDGHAWISDGCYYCVDDVDKTKIIETYLHCDWGWGGYCNGYYSSDVFNVDTHSFKPSKYFAVKMNTKPITSLQP